MPAIGYAGVSGAAGARVQVARLSDTKAQNTAGGTATTGSWFTRVLNTEDFDPNSIVSLAANEFTLAAGEYLIRWSAPALRVGAYQTRLYNVTGAAVILYGSTEFSSSGAEYAATRSHGVARINISAATAYRIEQYVNTTQVTNGLGAAGNIANEVYTLVEIERLGDAA